MKTTPALLDELRAIDAERISCGGCYLDSDAATVMGNLTGIIADLTRLTAENAMLADGLKRAHDAVIVARRENAMMKAELESARRVVEAADKYAEVQEWGRVPRQIHEGEAMQRLVAAIAAHKEATE